MSTHDETKPEERNGEAVEDEKLTVADDSVVRRKRRLEASNAAVGIPATVLRSALSSRQSIDDAVERRRNQHEAVDRDIDALAPTNAVAKFVAQLPASSTPSLSTTVVDRQPLIARAAPAAAKEPSIISRLLAPLGIGALATITDTPLAPVSPTTLMGVLELVRRELEKLFVNKTPTSTYNPGANIAANGAITGKVVGTDPDSTLTYTATSPAEGDVVIGPDGTFTFTPNANYDGSASFDVTISDESSGFHVHGLSGVLNLVTFGLVGESGHTHTQTVTVSGAVPPPDFQRTVVVVRPRPSRRTSGSCLVSTQTMPTNPIASSSPRKAGRSRYTTAAKCRR